MRLFGETTSISSNPKRDKSSKSYFTSSSSTPPKPPNTPTRNSLKTISWNSSPKPGLQPATNFPNAKPSGTTYKSSTTPKDAKTH